MKKSFLIIALALSIASCGGSKSNSDSADSSSTKQDAVAQNSSASADTNAAKTGTEATGASSKGEGLMASSDCSTCHRPDMKLVGPSFKEIANKYTDADVDKLADKIIKGGSGSWGDVAMTAHPALSVDDAKEMVKYILTKK